MPNSLKNVLGKTELTVVVGRDARISGEMVSSLVIGTLTGCGIDVIDLGLSTTPTVEVAVPVEKADGGIILIRASHNPKQWNALKLLNEKGVYFCEEGAELLKIAEDESFDYADVDSLGSIRTDDTDWISTSNW